MCFIGTAVAGVRERECSPKMILRRRGLNTLFPFTLFEANNPSTSIFKMKAHFFSNLQAANIGAAALYQEAADLSIPAGHAVRRFNAVYIQCGPSQLGGTGAFARTNIPANTTICDLTAVNLCTDTNPSTPDDLRQVSPIVMVNASARPLFAEQDGIQQLNSPQGQTSCGRRRQQLQTKMQQLQHQN